jgi:hypothetical protein
MLFHNKYTPVASKICYHRSLEKSNELHKKKLQEIKEGGPKGYTFNNNAIN